MVTGSRVVASDLAHLREEALSAVLLYASIAVFLWCLVLFQATSRFGPIWRGPMLLGAGLLAAFLVRMRSSPWAAACLLVGLTAADLYSMWLLGAQVAPYLLAVVVVLSALFFSLATVVLLTIAICGLVIAVGSLGLALPPLSFELIAPVLVVGLVGTVSALSVRNLYLVLYWAWGRTIEAQRNEKELRERRAELARTAKALDEACQRLEHLNYDLARAREVAEEARLLKQQFITNVSHELRTPLNVIVAFSEMMYMSPKSYNGVQLPMEYRGDVREIYRAGQHLLQLVDDVLDLSQIEAQRMRLRLESVLLVEVVTEAVEIMRSLVRGKEVELRAEIPEDLPAVLIDRARVRQVLLNLLNNARRFTDRGSISVRAAPQATHVQITIADTGVGIGPADHERIFDEFRQIDATTTRQRGGTGLGLAISKRFVEMHGGRIWVESTGVPGEGSAFHFTLPLAGSSWTEAGVLRRTPLLLAQPQGRGRSLLLLDQDPAAVRLLEQGLEGYRLTPVADITELPRLAGKLEARAVIVNAAQGRQAWKQMRQLRQLQQSVPPIIMCPLADERHLGQALGVLGYLVKPISRETIVALLDGLGDSVRRILVVDDDPRVARVLSRIIRSTGREYEVERAYSAEQALTKMRRLLPDLVLLDLIMPELDGRALLAKMRQSARLREVPVVVITAQELTAEEQRGLGGEVFLVFNGGGFSSEEALQLLRGTLDAIGAESVPQSTRQASQRRVEVSLGDRLAEVGGSPQRAG
jgi:signal transduction histidine kinase/CheY-like chemotaxis protein